MNTQKRHVWGLAVSLLAATLCQAAQEDVMTRSPASDGERIVLESGRLRLAFSIAGGQVSLWSVPGSFWTSCASLSNADFSQESGGVSDEVVCSPR